MFLTDDNTNTIVGWDGDRQTTFSTYATLPALAAPATSTQVSLGQLARKPDKTFYTTRFGFGNAGTVIEVSPAKVPRNVTGLAVIRRRIAMVVSPAGEMIDTWFTTPPSPGPTTTNGAISRLTVDATGAATETELVTGLAKPVGAALIGRSLFVSDQATGRLLAFSLDTVLATPQTASQGRTVSTFTTNLVSGDPGALTADNIDLLEGAIDGRLFLGGRGGYLYQVDTTTGAKTLIASLNTAADPGRLQVRGVAYDAANKRLFVAVHSTDTTKVSHSLRIFPID